MMDIVTGCSHESPLGFRANPQIRGTARRPRGHVITAAIAAAITTASSVVGAAHLPLAAQGTVLTALTRPAPAGEVTPTPPQIPPPTLKPTAAPLAPPPPQAEQPLPPPRQQQRHPPPEAPPPPPEAPAPTPEAPAPTPEAPAPTPEAPAPTPEAPAPPPEAPPSPPPGRGHVQLAP